MSRLAASRPLRMIAAGAINTAFGLGIYPLILIAVPFARAHYMLALCAAQAISVVFAFTTYKLGVFAGNGHIAREFGAFSGFYLFSASINWALLPVLVEIEHLPPIPAQIGLSLLLICGSWFWHDRVTFRQRGDRR